MNSSSALQRSSDEDAEPLSAQPAAGEPTVLEWPEPSSIGAGLAGPRLLSGLGGTVPTPQSSSTLPTSHIGRQPDASSIRFANRAVAASVEDREFDYLLGKRQRLLDKELDGTITRKEELELTYVRWSLDRIEDAMYGHQLDQLERAVAGIESLQDDIEAFRHDLDRIVPSRSKTR
jgi:hypothetical protein